MVIQEQRAFLDVFFRVELIVVFCPQLLGYESWGIMVPGGDYEGLVLLCHLVWILLNFFVILSMFLSTIYVYVLFILRVVSVVEVVE